ncbi:MAG: NifU family protein [Chloroflexi bacterium]|nr:NifU family protein [Chloroflexota bacterium]MBK6713488.1 NifU family protein [Chloroflexota bacterium]MBK7180702.1 NifU family protein [Chloroflexota bacterium]MBK7920646.1 NifU family protein [Chloroflexota bacterium]MBK8932835.1 NifU family protein [Chloroflexota bacterium]
MTMTIPAGEPETNNSASETERMRALIDSLSAYIEHFHGGAVRMVEFDGQILKVKMSGACDGCSLAPVTLHGWVEGTVKQFFPELESVEAI